MHKRKQATSLLCVFFLVMLFFLLLVPLLFPVLGSPDAQEHDYVDNNTSNVDDVLDLGTHSNFTAQQYGPDNFYDTLTEENTGGEGGGQDFVVLRGTTVISSTSTTATITEGVDYDLESGQDNTTCFIRLTNTHLTGMGTTSGGGSQNEEVFSVRIDNPWNIATSITFIRDGTGSDCRVDWEIIQYTGSPGGANEIIVLGTGDVATSGTTATVDGGTITTINDIDKVCCFITGQGGELASRGDWWIFLFTAEMVASGNDWIPRFTRGKSDSNVGHVSYAVVEFTGSNWRDIQRLEITDEATAWTTTNYDYYLDVTITDKGGVNLLNASKAFLHLQYRTDNDNTGLDDAWDNVEIKDEDELRIRNSATSGNRYKTVWIIENTQTGTGEMKVEHVQFYDSTRSGSEERSWTQTISAVEMMNATCIMGDAASIDGSGTAYPRGAIDIRLTSTTEVTLTESDTGQERQITFCVVQLPTAGDEVNYELDLEVQWTSATYNLPNEELCINGGTMGSESIQVDVWSGSTWHNLFTDLSSGWNNVSVTDYLVSSTFTIRFKGGTETGDTIQDSWQIDSTLLHTWGIAPIANFFYTPENPYTSETVTFNASDSYDPDGTIVSYFWDFGDGANSTGEVTTHTYDDDGTYTVGLTVTDNDGLSDITSKDITVLNRPPIATFTESAETVYTGETITFNASDSYDPDGTIVSYFWDFGDGTNATGVIVEHAYATNGTFIVTLTVTDDDGATASSNATKTILYNEPPIAIFTESAETVYTGETITFNATDSYDPDGSIVSYFWDFGDGSNATGIVVEHSYIDDGNYTVTLTVTDDKGAIGTTTATKTVLNRSPVASFTESAEIVLTGEAIYFNASDSYDPDGYIVSYFWDFGDGTNATGIIVDHAYADDGVYTVTLTVTDDDGATDTATSTKTILNRAPIAIFTESAETVYTGETIYFNASDSYDPDSVIVSYFWDFGDGTNATGATISHAYADDGIYTVTLTVTDDDGATDTTTSTKTVLNRSPVAIFSETAETVCTGETITFNATDSYDPDGYIVSYFWDFGDGTNASGVIVTHSYADDGNYTVTLTVTDDDGATASTNATKTILNRPPIANFTESAEVVYTGEAIAFNASSSYDPDGTIVSYFWDFGDGTNATGITVEHAYADDGVYTVTLTVTDDDGATDTATSTKTVLNQPPVASFTESGETVYTGDTITFDASASYDPDGYIATYFWDFGDGTNASGVVVEHAYADDGNYTVTLTVTDDDGATASATAIKTVLNRSPVASFTESAETVYTGETITFNATDSYDPDGYIVSYFWDFGDGINSTGVIVDHSYVDDGNYTVTLTVTDDDGATASTSSTKTVLNRPPVAIFTESAETVYTSETITFNASDSYDPDGSIVSYFWDFGDGINTTGILVEHAYVDDGVYAVTLTVTDNEGAATSTSATKIILNRPPVAIFTESATTVLTNQLITFNTSDSYDPDGSVVTYFWDFGDGTNATGVIVNHSYVDDGTYTVTLTVTDDDGATASTSATKTVLNRPPVAIFTESAETVYTDEVITFNASASYDPDGVIVSYFWDFGDGSNATGITVDHAYVDNGDYTVTLTVTDDDGATDSATATKTVLNRSPVASFMESAETVYTDETIYFNASDSYDPDGSIVSYFWDFGDGTNATGVTTEHSYPQDGNYTVTLTVTDDDGATNSTSANKTVLNRPPVALFTESAETVFTDEVITFNASSSYDPDGTIVSYLWDFGDGSNATGVTAEHSYADDGNYTVTLTVTDDDGATDTATAIKTVLNRPPVASFTESATTVLTGEVIHFNASASYDPDGSIVSYFWDFGDGTNASGVVVEHSYADDGNYTVTLTITDDDGATDTATSTKTVLNRPPVASFTESAETVYTGEAIAFNASDSYDPDGTIVGYHWDFGDGSNATGIIVEHSYSEDGNYTATLTVTDDDGATASTSAVKTVLNRPPVAMFTESAETVYTGEAISFNASDSYDPDGTIVSYFWDFGDGANASGVVVGHAYVDDGAYTVTLTVTDNDGATGTATSTKTVLNSPPVASFTEAAETVLTGEPITFNASDSYDPDGSIVSYFWDFGDGTNATGVVVDHAYADDGNYTVTVTITDDDGATDTATSTKTVLNRPPVASFTESAETVYTDEAITFNASASYDPDGTISYFWDFDDGTNATGEIVEHSYVDDGVYTVTLTITDDDGATDTSTSTKTVLNRPPVASFTESAETVYTSEVITFNASASYDPDGVIVSYFWDFGDGSNATGVIVDHAYADNGTYTVTLTVTDDDGTTDAATSTKTVLNRPPVAIFTESAEIVYTDEVIYLNASDSYDPDGTIVSYFWDFGDGSNATGVTAEHAYADDGNYAVTLTVTDNEGAVASSSSTKTVLNRPPVASFTESAETVYTGVVISFDASATYDPDGYIVEYFWDFGDGTNATGVTMGHSYADDGNYTVTLTVTDNDGATGTATAIKTILNRSPVATFTESATVVDTGTVISFDASASYDPDGYIVEYFWDFGDGTNATGVTVEHAYADDGSYVVTLTVTDDDGATGVATATKKVSNRPPVASFTESAEIVYTSEVISFNASASYDPDGSIVSYFWDFGDGTNATGITVDHAYYEDGNYTVTLTVTDDDGATDAATATKTVLNRPPVAIFTESAETVLVDETIYFNASDSYDPDGSIVSYFWDFGDGTNATGVTAEHAYTDNGVYTVILTITDNRGANDSATATKNVEVIPPVAIFTESATNVYTGETIYFNASDSYDPDGSIVSYFWDFGDGTNATGVTAEHAYADDGNYTVTLTVTDDDGATDSTTATKTVLNRSPVASFTESAETVYTGEAITFNASDSYDPDGSVVSYFWDFGDGTNATGIIVEHVYAGDGNYTVTLIVTDDDGAIASTMATKTVLNRSPVASFTESAESVVVGEIIYFNASDSYDPDGAIVSYFWDFGDGTNATGVTAEHAYETSGIYTVTLTVTDNDGATGTASAQKTVEVTPPVAMFTESAETVYTGETIYFNASDSYDPDGTIVSYFWDFGDGANATGVTAEHAYADDGNYNVTLTVTDDDDASDGATATKTILNRSPVASFTESAETVLTGETIYFNASDSYDPDGTIVSYFWDFGDGANATGVTAEHAYPNDGNYTVTLTVTDDDGASDIATATKYVGNSPPVASFTESAETVYTGETVLFDAGDSYDPDGTIVSYFWDFGDGTNATGVTVGHAYADDGNYTVTLTVTDDDGATGTASAVKTVLNRAPIVSFTQSATTVYTGQTITFDAIDSYDPDGYIVEYFWDFGDGTNATGITVDHTYSDDGDYTIVLTLTDDDGATGTASGTIKVLNRSPVASFTESAETVYTSENITFDATDSYDPDGAIVSYFWDFGDGTNATGIVVEHAYAEDGNYTVTLTVTDDDSATASTSFTKTILNRAPIALFTESAESVVVDETIYFNASASYDPDGTIVSYFWDFGDGANATSVTAEHAYNSSGVYTLTLTVTDDDGATGTASAQKTVEVTPPVAIFTESAETVLTGETIYFNASDSYDPDGTIVKYFWDFGDSANTTGVVADHTYADDGNYTVTLTVTDDDGASDSATATKKVLNRPPVAIFTESTETVLTSETITFNASDSYDSDGTIVSYLWDFGDGANATGVFVEHAYADDGNYTVTLTVTDDDGAIATATANKTVLNRPPIALFTESSESVYTSETITFNASASYDPDGSIASYFWDFSDGKNATGVVVDHTYADDGNYTVTLTVTDDDGATDFTSATKTVLNRAPVASFTESAETVVVGETIYFNASHSHDPDGSIVSYFWDFGDGTNVTGVVVDHAYADDGNYTVTLTVTDDDGTTAKATSTKTVLNRPPVAIFTESAESVLTDEAIYFNASDSYDPDGYIIEYFWDFGDGTNVTGVTVEHAYAENGTYAVTLTITDDDGASDAATVSKYVGNSPPVASFAESAETVYTGETVSFDASDSYDPDGFIVSYFWDFGDGTNATEMTVGHSYADNGNYTVTLAVTDDDGATGTASAVKTVLNRAPIASFTQSKTIVYTGELIHFDASGSYDPDGIIVEHFWDFGDGTNATGVTVDHAYADDGDYTITLTLTDDDDATGTASGTAKAFNRSPVASFTESAETVYTNEIITFNASYSYDLDGTIVSYFWDFGDGTNATGVTVSHSYADDGNYTVTLTVTDDDGANDFASSTKTVLNQAPVATFTESTETAYTGETFTFNASDSYDPDGYVVGYFWDFGDDANGTGVVVDHAYADDGNYTITLAISDDDGASASTSATKTVLNRAPVASFTESAEIVLTSESITFDASSSYDPDGSIVSYFWDLGDGTNAAGVMVDHTYSDDGNYTVTLTVTDDDGATASVSSIKTVLNRSPIAVFTESTETVYVGQVIYFNASDSYDPDGYVVGYFWDFGDGTNSTGAIVEHAYDINGTYTVTLTVTDDDDATNSASSVKTILWNEPPVTVFTESAETVYTGETIVFDASSSYDPDGTIIGYFWDFGDGSNATGVAVEYAYAGDGNYSVTLTATDDKGAAGSTSATKTVLNRAPVASFTESAETVYIGEIIYFNASDSYDPDGTIVNYFWDFGDGTNSTGVMVDHTYSDDGNYTVTLTVTDDDGATASVSSTKTMLNRAPVASFVYSPDSPIAGEAVTLNALDSYDPDGYIVNYTWDFGDGNVTTSTTPVMAHVYAAEGNYLITLTVTDDDSATGIAEGTVRIRNYPTATFTYSPVYPGEGQPVSFDASSSTPNGGIIVNYTWDFGDGNVTTVTEAVTIHAYEVAGNYTVTLTVTDNEELSDFQSKTVEVGVPPVASFTYSPTYPFAGDTVTFDASSSYDADGYIVNYTWDFGDGNVTTVTEPMISHVYTKGGNYTVKLAVIDNKGCTDTKTDILGVKDYPTADFTWSPSYPIVNEATTFDASSSSPNGGVITHYFWDFGDGSPSANVTDPITTHAYTAVGNYTVTLTVTDSEGLSDTISHTLRVRDYPKASFTYSPESPIASITTITFDASSSTPNHGVITSYEWNFGDGNMTTAATPIITHVYSVAGNYTVTLTVTDSEGVSDSTTQTVTVRQAPPVASFTYSPDFPMKGETVTFNASSSYDPDGIIVSYFWDFGDGNLTTVITPITHHSYATVGNYTVALTVTDNDDLSELASYTLKVRYYPTADFTWSPLEPEAHKPATFDASTSTPDGGVIISYEWHFGDGNVTTVSNSMVTHCYETFGEHTVTLKVTDSEGLWDTESTTLKVIASPHADFTWSPTIPRENETVTFDASTSVPNGGMLAFYLWDFGDGSFPELVTYRPTITHQYTTGGNYTVTLTTSDSEDLNDTVSKTITIGAPPNANFTWFPQYPQTYEIMTFNASISSPNGGAIISYKWDFGDGNVTTAADPVISHYYSASGDYLVILKVTDSEGLVGTESKTISVAAAVAPHADFMWSPLSPYVNETITFNASASTPNGGVITSYTWDFGDGEVLTMFDPIAYHSYLSKGNYTVALNVTDSQGCWSSISRTINILPTSGPTADFIWDPALPIFNETVTFDASTSTLGWDGTHHPLIVSYLWDFGDGNLTTITAPKIEHSYSQTGNYTVTLTVIDAANQSDSVSFVIEVLEFKYCDVNGDGFIDIKDILAVVLAYGSGPGDPNWDPRCDVNGDGFIDIKDILAVAMHYGEDS